LGKSKSLRRIAAVLNITAEVEGTEKGSGEKAKKKQLFEAIAAGEDEELDQQLAGGRTGRVSGPGAAPTLGPGA
jgi:hypothetical protein